MIGKMLSWLQERIKRWTKPATLPLILGLLPDITRNRADQMRENAMLCQPTTARAKSTIAGSLKNAQ